MGYSSGIFLEAHHRDGQNMTAWTEQSIETFKSMYLNGASIKTIAETLNTTHSAVKMYAQRHRSELGLSKRIKKHDRPKSPIDKEWYGSVPYLHWTITKAWSKR